MSLDKIKQLGDPDLYIVSSPVEDAQLRMIDTVVKELHECIIAFRKKYGVGRAIAAPQTGCRKRLIYMLVDKPIVINSNKLIYTS